MDQSISIKELRNRLPQVLKDIQKGMTYMLIYQSRPVGQIGPLASNVAKSGVREKPLAFFSHDQPNIKIRSKKRAAAIIREDRS